MVWTLCLWACYLFRPALFVLVCRVFFGLCAFLLVFCGVAFVLLGGCSELWLRDAIDTVEEVFAHAARSFTLRLAETLSQYICSLTRRAEALATPETECLLYATYWFRPILSELIGAAKESAEVNRKRAPSGPVKVVVTNQPHSRRHTWLVGVRPYWRGVRLAGLARLRRVS